MQSPPRAALLFAAIAIAAYQLGCSPNESGQGSCGPTAEELRPVSPHPPRVWFALVDRSASYIQHTRESLTYFTRILSELAEPGDWILAGWIGRNPDSAETTFLNERIAAVATPPVPPSIPTPPSHEGQPVTARRAEAEECARYRQAHTQQIEDWGTATTSWQLQGETQKQESLGRLQVQILALDTNRADDVSGICDGVQK